MAGPQPDDEDRTGRCRRCKEPTVVPGYLWETVKLWNREHAKDLEGTGQRPQYITAGDIVVCDACVPLWRAEREVEERQVYYTTQVYLRELRQGRYNPESQRWLREHGYADEVRRVLGEEGVR